MKRKNYGSIALKSLFIALLCCHGVIALAQFAGGSGTEDDPWLIARPSDLDNVRDYLGVANRNKHWRQINDIDLDEHPWNDGEGWQPIGSSTNAMYFTGHYDGNGFVVNNLFINRPGVMYQGLFGNVQNVTIENLGVTNVDVTGQQYSGPIFGYGTTDVILRNCWTSGSMRGFNTSTGGLVGYLFRGITVENCYSLTEVVGNNYVGGLIGMIYQNHVIKNCYTRGTVTGNNQVGGLIGLVATGDSEIESCFAACRMQGNANVGGLVGENRGSPVATSYWDLDVSGTQQSGGGTGKTTEQMIYPYVDGLGDVYIRWDFDEIWTHDTNGNINSFYPCFHWQVGMTPVDSPMVNIKQIIIDGVDYVRVSWELVEDATSYKVYSSNSPVNENWGEPITVVGENTSYYDVPAGEAKHRFFYVTAFVE